MPSGWQNGWNIGGDGIPLYFSPPPAPLREPHWWLSVYMIGGDFLTLLEAWFAGTDNLFALRDALLETGHADLADKVPVEKP